MTAGFPYEEMPPGPAHTWVEPLDRFLVDLERLEDATAQFVEVAVPDLIDAGVTGSADMLHDRIAGTIERLKTALTAMWFEAAR